MSIRITTHPHIHDLGRPDRVIDIPSTGLCVIQDHDSNAEYAESFDLHEALSLMLTYLQAKGKNTNGDRAQTMLALMREALEV